MEYDIESILEMYEDDYNPGPRPMNQGPRNMYNQGQLVQPNADGSRPGYNGRKNKKISYDKENKIIKEYNTYLSDEVKSGNMSKSLGFKSWLRENKTPAVFEKTYNAWSKKLLNVKPASVTDAKVGLLKTFVERANEQGQFVEKKKLLELIGRTQTPGVAEKNVYIENILNEINKLDSREDKVHKAFNKLFNNELVFVTDPDFYKKFPSDKEAGSITRMLIQETGLTGPTLRQHRTTWKKDNSKVPFFNTKKGKEQLKIIEHMNLKMGKVGEATFDGFNFNDLMEYGANSKKGKMFYKSATGSDFYKNPNNVVRDFVVRHFDHNSKFGDKSKLIEVFKKGTNTEIKYEAGKRLTDFDFTYQGKKYGSNELAKEYLKWTRGENTPFKEVYDNHKLYTDFLRKPVNIGDSSVKNIGDLFRLAGHQGMAIEHGSLGGVAEEPFKNLKLLSSRANSEIGTILQYYKNFPDVQKLLVDEFVKELPVNENYIDALAKNEIKIAKDMLKNGNTTIPMTYNQAAKNVLTTKNIKNFLPEELLTVSKSAFGKDIGYKTFANVSPENFENIKTKNQLTKLVGDFAFDINTPEGRLNMKKLNTSVAFQKFLKDNGIVVPGCGRQKVVTGGRITFSNGTCGGFKNADEFAKGDPENFLNTVQADPKASKAINNADASVMKNVFKWAAKDIKRPTGWLGGDIAVSTIFTAGGLEQGQTPLEAIDQGLLWFVPNSQLKKVGLGDAYKKALTKGMSEGESNYIKKALDLEMADKNYFTNKDELESLEKQLKNNPKLFSQVTSQQIENSKNRLKKNIKDSINYGSQIFMDLGDRQGTTLPGTKTSAKNYKEAYTTAQDELFKAKKQKAVTGSNISKQYDLGREYQKYLNDIIMPDFIEKGLGKTKEGLLPGKPILDRNYQDYDILGDKSSVFTDYTPSPTRPFAPVTATIGRLAGNYANTKLPFSSNVKRYLENIAVSRGKENLTIPTTMDNLTQQDFDRLNQFQSGIKRDYAEGGITTLRSKYEYKK